MARKKRYKSWMERCADPRWQRKRAQICERDGWQCTDCGDSHALLNVHHHYYDGSNPWDYPDSALSTLCERCHKRITSELREILAFAGTKNQRVELLIIVRTRQPDLVPAAPTLALPSDYMTQDLSPEDAADCFANLRKRLLEEDAR